MPQIRKNSITFDRATKTFTQLDPPEKPVKVELTVEDKKRVIEEFRGLFNREPDEEEKEDLFLEELKLKRARGIKSDRPRLP